MKIAAIAWNDFWPAAAITALTLAGMVAMVSHVDTIYGWPGGKRVASALTVMSSQVVLTNPGVTGYYEQLFQAPGHPMFMSDEEFKRLSKRTGDRLFVARSRHGSPEFDYDEGFRTYRFKPNLANLRIPSEPQGVTTNSFGMASPEITLKKPAGTRRIALFGDSMTQGWGNDQNSSYGRQFERLLNAKNAGEKFEVLNFAVPAYQLTQIMDVAHEDAARFQPDVYLLGLTELAVFRTWDTHLVRLMELGIDLKYDFLRRTIARAGVSDAEDSMTMMDKLAPERMPVIRECLLQMKSDAERAGAKFVVALVPSLEDGQMSEKRLDEMPAVLGSLGIRFVDLRDTFESTPDVSRFRINARDVHPNTQGHAMLAENLYRKVAVVLGAGF